MNKGQGSLEYLLILAAILAIAVVVVVVAQSMLAPGRTAGEVTGDKYKCGLAGIELTGFDTTDDQDFGAKYSGASDGACAEDDAPGSPSASCSISKAEVYVVLSGEDLTCTFVKKG